MIVAIRWGTLAWLAVLVAAYGARTWAPGRLAEAVFAALSGPYETSDCWRTWLDHARGAAVALGVLLECHELVVGD
ncbi:MAG: hypothetical protein AAB368_01805, partial [bacterium]